MTLGSFAVPRIVFDFLHVVHSFELALEEIVAIRADDWTMILVYGIETE